jgi:hypothetical protein
MSTARSARAILKSRASTRRATIIPSPRGTPRAYPRHTAVVRLTRYMYQCGKCQHRFDLPGADLSFLYGCRDSLAYVATRPGSRR